MASRDATPAPSLRIVIIEDDPATLEALAMALTLDGHEVACAANGEQGLAQIREVRPDLVIVDWMMPVLDGLSLTKQLREEQRLSRLPIFMMSAKALHRDAAMGLRAGVDTYFPKPVDLDVLCDEVLRLCSRRPHRQDRGQLSATPSPDVELSRAKWAAAVTAAMTERNLTLLHVGIAGKVSPATLAQVLAGDGWPRTDTVLAVSTFLDIDPPDDPLSRSRFVLPARQGGGQPHQLGDLDDGNPNLAT